MEYTELAFGGIRTLAICIGALATLRGMNTWRNQMIGKHDYDLAKRLLTLVFDLQGVIRMLRSPFEPNDSTLWARFSEVGSAIDTAFVEARVHWGDGIMKHNQALLDCTNKFRLAKARIYAAKNDGMPEEAKPEAISEFSPIRYSEDTGNRDLFAEQVKDAIEGLADELRPHLRQSLRAFTMFEFASFRSRI